MTEPIRWGILGTGAIAATFTDDVRAMPDHAVVAVGSRREETAAAFAAEHGIARAHGSYAALAADSDVDVVYVATPHPGHLPAAVACLEAGRNVLVEKPFAMTAAEGAEIAATARRHGLFCQEAMWTRFHPLVRRIRTLVADGAIGEVRAFSAEFGFAARYDPASRLFAPELGGGALLDLGVYPVSFAWMLLGAPATVSATAGRAGTGVDANTAILLGYDSGAAALLHCTLEADSPDRASILGTTGRIELPTAFFHPTSFTLHRRGAEPETVTEPDGGFTHQAAEVGRCLRAGLVESPLLPLDESVAILGTLDEVRARFSE